MKEQFVTYDLAIKLKELGFDEECLASYCQTPVFDAGVFELGGRYTLKTPLWQRAFKFILSVVDLEIDSLSDYAVCFNKEFYLEERVWDFEGCDISIVCNGNEATLSKLIELAEKQKGDEKD